MASILTAASMEIRQKALPAGERKSEPSQFVVTSGGSPIRKTWDFDRAVRYGYANSSWVFAAIDRIAKAGSSVPWCVKRREGGKMKLVEGHEHERMIEHPNRQMSRKFLMWQQIQQLLLSGNGLRKIAVDELWPLNPARTTPIPGEAGSGIWLAKWEVRDAKGKKSYLEPEEVIHTQIPDPSNPLWGMSPTQPIGAIVDTDSEAVLWNRESMRNRAVPDGALVDPNAISEEQYQQIEDELEMRVMGSHNARRPMILSAGANWLPMQRSPAEMDFVESRKHFASEIAAALGYLAAMFSTEAQTYDNLRTAVRFMWENAVIPILDLFADTYTLALVPWEQRGEVEITYDLSGIEALQENTSGKVKAAETLVGMGVPSHVAFRVVDLPITEDDVPHGDRALINQRLVLLDEVLAGGGGIAIDQM